MTIDLYCPEKSAYNTPESSLGKSNDKNDKLLNIKKSIFEHLKEQNLVLSKEGHDYIIVRVNEKGSIERAPFKEFLGTVKRCMGASFSLNHVIHLYKMMSENRQTVDCLSVIEQSELAQCLDLYSLKEGMSATAKLMKSYEGKQWNVQSKAFEGMQCDMKKIALHINYCTTIIALMQEKHMDVTKHHGHIEKRDVAESTKIFLRADIHGDLKSLIHNLKNLQSQGLLDVNFKCKDDVQLVFLGDYTDRGSYGLQVLELLAFLKAENVDNVHLIKGNHENISMHRKNGDDSLKGFLSYHSNRQVLQNFYNTMPLTIYIGQESEGAKQYVQFTHGLFDIDVDIQSMMDSKKAVDSMLVPIERKSTFSDSIQAFTFKGLTLQSDAKKLTVALEQCVDAAERKKVKMLIAAQKIDNLIQWYTSDFKFSSYCWGDITAFSNVGLNQRQLYGVDLNLEDIEYALQLNSINNVVGAIFRGHQHAYREHKNSEGKVFITTMPISENVVYSKNGQSAGVGLGCLLTTANTLEEWTKEMVIQNELGEVELAHSVGLYDNAPDE